MGTIAQKLAALITTKEAIRQAIIAKNQECAETVPFSGYPAKISAIQTGGGSGTYYWVRYWDWRGKLIYEEEVAEGSDSTPPIVATTENAVFHSWAGDYTNVIEETDIYAQYTTVDDATYFHMNLTDATGLSPTLRFSNVYYDHYTIYWGDGTSQALGTGSPTPTHTYATPGKYVIKIAHVPEASYAISFGQGFNKGVVFGNYIWACTDILVGKMCFLNYQGLYGLNGLKYLLLSYVMTPLTSTGVAYELKSLNHLTFPTSLTRVPDFTSSTSLNSLKSIYFPSINIIDDAGIASSMPQLEKLRIPQGTTKIPARLFSGSRMKEVIIPSSVTSIGASAFSSMQALREIAIPDGVTTIPTTILSACYSLEKVEFGSGVTSIGAYAFSVTYNLQTVIFNSANPPTIAADSLNTPNLSCLYYVPDASLAAYKAATNWSTIASRILPKSSL